MYPHSPLRRIVAPLPTLFLLSTLLTLAATAQTASLAVSTVSISINPAATDSYTLQGTIDGLSLTGASSVGFSVGNFGASIPLSSFTQQGATNVFTYQDTTGQAPGWISSLTLNLDAHTFKAQATNTVLAGLTNPFAVRLGTDQDTACTIVRVQQGTPGSYQLTPGDRVGMTCELGNAPVAVPNVVLAATPTSVTIDASALQFSANDTPQEIQLFRADDNAQPTGTALCALSLQTKGDYTCTVSFNEATPGTIPLIIEATVSGQPVLSPGFSLQVAASATTDNAQQILKVETGMVQAWQDFVQYGDSAYARVQALLALRKIIAPPVALTGSPLGLSLDQLSIYVRTSAGVPMVLPLEDVADTLTGASKTQAVSATQAKAHLDTGPKPRGIIREPPSVPDPQDMRLTCNSPKRDIVRNDKVLVWSPGDLFGFKAYKLFVAELQRSRCPTFSVTMDIGSDATIASLSDFSNYGTIIINTHGTYDHQLALLVTGDPAPDNSATIIAYIHSLQLGVPTFIESLGIACVPQGCFQAVYPTNSNIQATSNTIIYGGFCHSLEGGRFGFAQAFAPAGSNSTYYGFFGPSFDIDDVAYGNPLFEALVDLYQSTGDAYKAAIGSAGTNSVILTPSSNIRRGSVSSEIFSQIGPRDITITPKFGSHFGVWNNLNLAYLGNPKLTTTDQPPPAPGSQNLSAYLDGTASCGDDGAPYLTVHWSNTATAGHLDSLTSRLTGGQDDFENRAMEPITAGTAGTLVSDWALATYTPDPTLLGSGDDIDAYFYPDVDNQPAARACLSVQGRAGLFVDSQLAAVYDAANPQTLASPATFSPPQQITSTYSVPLSDSGDYVSMGASAKVTVTPLGRSRWTLLVEAGGAKPSPTVNVGPYEGKSSIDLVAINPEPSGGSSSITISGVLNITPICALPNVCAFPDGHLTISDSEGNIVANMSLYNGDDPTNPFSFTADSSKSGSAEAYPVHISIGLASNGGISMPASFSAVLHIEFLRQLKPNTK